MTQYFQLLEEELWNHYEPAEEDNEGWYRCIHCGQKIYYRQTKPEDLTRHIPDEIFWTSDERDGCSERVKTEQDS